MDDVIALLRQLVAVDSTSTKPNGPLLDVLERVLAPLGAAVQRQRYVDAAGVEKANLVVQVGAGTPELALVGHSDCVPFDAGWTEALRLTERDGKLYGRGANDTKAFIAAACVAALDARRELHRPFALVFTADEELGCLGAKKLVEAGLGRCRQAIIGEPTSLRPIRANKGYCLAEIEVLGKEGHSAYPDTGANANVGAAKLIAALDTYARGALRERVHPGFSPPFTTLNVGLMSGGKAKNVIGGSARFTLEWRPLPDQDVRVVLDEVHRLRDALLAEEPRFQVRVDAARLDRGYDTRADAELVRFLEQATGMPSDTVAFGTEGPQLAALGAVPVVFGPGDITVAHQTGEYVPVAELQQAADVLRRALVHFCGRASA